MGRIECLDGLRGLAALWVLVGHCMLLTGFMVPILSKPDLGVDLVHCAFGLPDDIPVQSTQNARGLAQS